MNGPAKLNDNKVLYTGRTRTVGGREGQSRSDDGLLDVKLGPPGGGAGTNPEQLLAAGWSACFESAMGIAARKRRLTIPADTVIDAEIDLLHGEAGYSLAARLTVEMPGIDRDVTRELVEIAHQTCPYSKALRGNIGVDITIV